MRTKLSAFAVVVVFLTLASPVQAQAGWKQPPKNVVDILDAPPTPRVQVSPDGQRALLVSYDPYPPLEMLARPFEKLAGLRIDGRLNARQRTTRSRAIEILEFESGKRTQVELPKDASVNAVRWAPVGTRFAFTNDLVDGVELWIGDAATGAAQAVPKLKVSDVLGAPFSWVGGDALIVRALPNVRPSSFTPRIPNGPVVEETAGKVSKVMTFQDLLKNPADEAAFEYYGTSELMMARLSGADAPEFKAIGKAGLYAGVDSSPGAPVRLLVTRLKRPFSYRVPSGRFAQTTEVWSLDGAVERVVADLPVADEIPPQGVATGPRGIQWRPMGADKPSDLVWVEALDGGDPLKKVPHRDRVMTLAPPFVGEPREVMKVVHRFAGIDWTGRPNEAFLLETNRDKRWVTTHLVDLSAPDTAAVLFDRSMNDAYKDPGNPLQEETPDGSYLMIRDGDWVFLSGSGASESGDRPFLDRLNLATKKVERLWQSAEQSHETFAHFVGASRSKILIRSESRTEPPNWFIVDLASGERRKVTDFKDPAPELTKVKKERLKYKRADGCQLTGTLYLPPGYQEGTRLPLIVWAYPLEYSDAGTAGQVRGSTKTFTRLAGDSPLFFLLNGYAVLMDATMPVIGDPEKMNDTFVEQIVSSAQAAVEKVASMGVADPNRCCVSGHSYGAFMTANLLAHSDLFAAGIARSGAYNRTLTPFGFQSERRSYWEATDVYTRMSPFTYANKINEPLLMIHGDADNNPGTHTIQSERLFQAIRGNGGTARLVLLPYESHGYRARENVLQVLAEMFEWADKYVKNRQVPQR